MRPCAAMWSFWVLLCVLTEVYSLRLRYLKIPPFKPEGDDVSMVCDYDVEGQPLYSVKWYKDMKQFFSYEPNKAPQFTFSNVSGVSIDLNNTGRNVVRLLNVDHRSSGTYLCEVSVDAPTFYTASNYSTFTVLELPKSGPKISGGRSKYAVGDDVEVNCTSEKSRPAADLQWSINRIPANNSWLVHYDTRKHERDLSTSTLGLRFRVEQRHFNAGTMQLQCTATIHTIYTETHVERYSGQGPHTSDLKGSSGCAMYSRISTIGAALLLFHVCFLYSN